MTFVVMGAFITKYDDPGIDMMVLMHGNVGDIFQVVLEEQSGTSDFIPTELQFLEMMVGVDAKEQDNVKPYSSYRNNSSDLFLAKIYH